MPDVEKVIKGLGEALTLLAEYVPCEGYLGYAPGACLDAIELLKSQEPRVMADTELEAIRKAPLILKPNVDAAPVVRCRDCEFYGEEPIGTLKECYRGCGLTKPSDYCSRGKRRESE